MGKHFEGFLQRWWGLNHKRVLLDFLIFVFSPKLITAMRKRRSWNYISLHIGMLTETQAHWSLMAEHGWLAAAKEDQITVSHSALAQVNTFQNVRLLRWGCAGSPLCSLDTMQITWLCYQQSPAVQISPSWKLGCSSPPCPYFPRTPLPVYLSYDP